MDFGIAAQQIQIRLKKQIRCYNTSRSFQWRHRFFRSSLFSMRIFVSKKIIQFLIFKIAVEAVYISQDSYTELENIAIRRNESYGSWGCPRPYMFSNALKVCQNLWRSVALKNADFSNFQ